LRQIMNGLPTTLGCCMRTKHQWKDFCKATKQDQKLQSPHRRLQPCTLLYGWSQRKPRNYSSSTSTTTAN
jgi:hypothetical protein